MKVPPKLTLRPPGPPVCVIAANHNVAMMWADERGVGRKRVRYVGRALDLEQYLRGTRNAIIVLADGWDVAFSREPRFSDVIAEATRTRGAVLMRDEVHDITAYLD